MNILKLSLALFLLSSYTQKSNACEYETSAPIFKKEYTSSKKEYTSSKKEYFLLKKDYPLTSDFYVEDGIVYLKLTNQFNSSLKLYGIPFSSSGYKFLARIKINNSIQYFLKVGEERESDYVSSGFLSSRIYLSRPEITIEPNEEILLEEPINLIFQDYEKGISKLKKEINKFKKADVKIQFALSIYCESSGDAENFIESDWFDYNILSKKDYF